MARVVVVYRTPKDKDAFDRYYAASHIPLARALPGLVGYDISRGPVETLAGDGPVHLIATLTFASMDAYRRALASPEGQAATADLANFADGGAEIYVFETETL